MTQQAAGNRACRWRDCGAIAFSGDEYHFSSGIAPNGMNACSFVTGHGFSRAVNAAKSAGL
jgi:hypothetical protein